ncbi:WYL domain-containing protein [Corynebacterium zhongnanshanii]|uniref:WYL domain-containing protein n=1 Tax=Corynebacterium zhongnanshanii TaxID=2768834 RepID=A0ABQ6VGS9_9CORY|nr:WYL domain-containing protein [Corynebacterium zhongnanshanii]KAB3523523.1 WYL domain-containing protein [Corynebacterium zhongnanshanii]
MNPKLTMQQQFERSLTLLAWFRNHPDASFLRASQELNIPVPQIRHELSKLMLCGLPNSKDTGFLIDINIGRTSASVMQDAGLSKPLNLSVMEAGALLLSLEAVRSTLPQHRHAAVDSAVAKIKALMRGERAALTAAGVEQDNTESGTTSHGPLTGLAQDMSQAVTQRSLVRCEYRSLHSDTFSARVLVPDHLGLIEGTTYLWAREVDDEGRAALTHKKFRLDRMERVDIDAAGSADFAGLRKAPTIDPSDPFGFDATSTPDAWASLELSPQARWMLEYYPMWQETPDTQDDGSSSITVAFPNTGVWLERFLVANAERITPIAPEGLGDRVRQRALRGLSAYSQGDS